MLEEPQIGDIWEYIYTSSLRAEPISISHLLILDVISRKNNTCSILFLESGSILTGAIIDTSNMKYRKLV